MPYLPAFANPMAVGTRIMNGVNYASAGAGILDATGRHWVNSSFSAIIIRFVFLSTLTVANFQY